jgi:hypothetical protein
MALTFDKTQPDLCLITDTNPNHFILPYLGLRFLCIKGATSALTMSTNPAGKAHARLATSGERATLPSVTGTHAWVRLTGQEEGETRITFREGTESKELIVNVYPWKWLMVNFFLVTDANGRPTFNASQTGTHISRLDKVYRSQACIDFSRHLPTRRVSVSMNCSLPMTAAQETTMWNAFRDLTPNYVRTNRFFNVFVVKAWGGHDNPATGYDAWATSHGIYLIIDDAALSNTTPVLAHEIGHGMGLEHAGHVAGQVMIQGLTKGYKLKWTDVETVRGYVS